MEDSESEWLGECSGNGNWILKKGLTYGKRILVAGFVITSAPIILPPLVVISAIGVACSVPYGLFLASYACTKKIMSKLLPCPTSPPLFLENGLRSDDDGEELRAKDESNYMEEQGMLLEETKGEARVKKLVDGNNEIVDENRYDEHVDRHLDNEDERSLQEIEMKVEGIKEKDLLIEESQVGDGEASAISIEIAGGGNQAKLEEAPIEPNVVVELYKGHSDYEQDDELVIGRGSLLEKIRDEGKHESQVKEYIYSVNNISRSSNDKDQGDNRDDKGVKLPSAPILQKYVASEDGVVSDHRHANNILTKELRNGKDKSNMLSGIRESDHLAGTVNQDLQMNKEIGVTKSSNLDVRETADESGLDLFDPKNAANLQCSKDDARETADESGIDLFDPKNAANLQCCKDDARETADESGLDLFDPKNAANLQCSKDDETFQGAKQLEDNAIDSLEVTLPVRVQGSEPVALYSEEMIWEQINAMRVIVGYTAAPHKTCTEELKALYVFTGIEPSSLFKEQSDLVEANDKLRFLMSIIGVK
ncbi:hypothetical protein K2173_025630 [Erythroxylum novogranatense]|uniref:Uncharacterized protein n=1 Tax=Erythroxylum novogranatense TaxID=1862640 RepID=A0AAV8SNV2_9ROSI|nr:hypothetical protein K2173_025630 [Erythroxylum novogranatense]